MKHVMILGLCLLLSGCLADEKKKFREDGGDFSYIHDIWEYLNPDGTCSAGEWFGDSSNGCVKAAQVIRFADGSAFIALNLGNTPAMQWSWTRYLPPDTATFEEMFYLGSNVSFKISGDMSQEKPLLRIAYDHTLNYADTPDLLVVLTEVRHE